MAATTTAIALLAGGQAISGFIDSRKQAKGVERMGAYEAQVLETNAQYSEQQAKDVLEIGKEQESRHMAQVRQLIGSQRAAIGASGIDISSGSAKDIQEEAAFLGELDRLTIQNNAAREAWGYRVQAQDLRNRAKLAKMGALNQASGIRAGGYSTLLTGAAQVGSLYYGSRSTSTSSSYSGGIVAGRPYIYSK